MGLESADTIAELNSTWPLGTDQKSQGDDHIRMIKRVLKADVPQLINDKWLWYNSTTGYDAPAIAGKLSDGTAWIQAWGTGVTQFGAKFTVSARADDNVSTQVGTWFRNKALVERGFVIATKLGAGAGALLLGSKDNTGTVDASIEISPTGVDCNGLKLYDLGEPTAGNHAATKTYVDAADNLRVQWYASANGYDGPGVNIKASDGQAVQIYTPVATTIMGARLSAQPRSDDTVSTQSGAWFRNKAGTDRGFVVAQNLSAAAGSLLLGSKNSAGANDATIEISPTGVDCNGLKLYDLGEPTAGNHAATKTYVDTGLSDRVNWYTSSFGYTAEAVELQASDGTNVGIFLGANTTLLGGTFALQPRADDAITTDQLLNLRSKTGVIRGSLYADLVASAGYVRLHSRNSSAVSDGNIAIYGNASAASQEFRFSGAIANKSTSGSWTATSDARIKSVKRDYEAGLAEILQLQPRVFTYLGNDFTTDPAVAYPDELEEGGDTKEPVYPQSVHAGMETTEIVGLIAQEAEIAMPDLVKQKEGWIGDEHVTDMRDLDPSNLVFALINAVKELSARVAELEAAA